VMSGTLTKSAGLLMKKGTTPLLRKALQGSFETRLDWFEKLPDEKKQEVKDVLYDRIVTNGKKGSRSDDAWNTLRERAETLLAP
jgi:phosphoribosyl-ATP pyrophosphohydrolase